MINGIEYCPSCGQSRQPRQRKCEICDFEYNSILLRKNAIRLTKPEINHLFGLIECNERSGEYTAPLEQYWLRSDRIKSKLRESA